MVRLRPHHLLCLLTFVGEGYTPEFVANFDAVVRRIRAGEAIELIDGRDDVCAPLEGTGDVHCASASVARRDRAALLALAESGLAIDERPLYLERERLASLRDAFAAGTIRAACRGCNWDELCTAVAAGGYRGSPLTIPPQGTNGA